MAKFKVGDKVRVRKDLVAGERYARNSGHNCVEGLLCGSSMPNLGGEVLTISAIDTHRGVYQVSEYFYMWCDEMLEPAEFTKADLKDGMVVEFRNGDRHLVLNGIFMAEDGWMPISDYQDNLINQPGMLSENYDIMKVYTSSSKILKSYFDNWRLTLIWERKEEEPVKEMTVAEIEEKLGYKVKVIADKE